MNIKQTACFINSILVMLLSGCTQVYWSKPGFTQEQWDIDLAQCNLVASQNVPPNYRTSYSNIGDSTTNCYNYGYTVQCKTTPPIQIPITVDMNETAREQFRDNCLTLLGYQKYTK